MPDLDHLPRGVRRGWGRVADAVRGGQHPDVVSDAMEKAISKSVRLLSSDLGWLVDLDTAIQQSHDSGSIEALDGLLSSLDPCVTRGVEAVFVDEARSLALSDKGSDLRDLLVGGLLRMPDKLCLAAIEPDLVGSSFVSYAQWRAYRGDALGRVNAGAIADRILRSDMRTATLRAPRTRLPRPGTKALLDAAIP